MIDRKPAVGRYLLKHTIWIHGFCHRGGLITKIAGQRIYIDCEYSSPSFERIDAEYVNKFAAICDTREEFEMLLAHGKKCMVERQEQERAQAREWAAFFTKDETK